MRYLPTSATLALLAASLLASPAVAQEPEETADTRFTVDDAVGLVGIADPRISPDGGEVLFTRSTLDWEENERPDRIWVADADGSDVRPYTAEPGDDRPRWSPDGRWVAFARSAGEEGDETRQVFLIRTDGGEARRLTSHPTAVRSHAWGPEGRRLYFVADDTVPDEVEERREAGGDAVFVNEGPNGQSRGSWSNLWWVPADPDSGEARPLTRGERIVGEFAVSPSGDRVAFTYRTENHRNDPHRSEIAVVDVATGEIRDLTDNEAPESDLAWSPDGGRLAFLAPDLERWRLDQGNLYVRDLASGGTRRVARGFDGEIQEYRWLPGGEAMLVSGLVRTEAELFRLDLETDGMEAVTRLEGTVGAFTVSADGRRVAFTFEDPRRPEDVYVVEPGGEAAPTRVTRSHGAVEAKDLADPETVRWTSEDGREIEGLLYRPAPGAPPEAGALVLEIHGGPAGVFARGFDADAQVLAAHGYAVLQPNVRGSTGYGDEHLRANMEDIGGGDYRDLMTGVDAVLERGTGHADSLAVKGWSYGGILGGWTITRTDRFEAASLGAMVSHWPSEFGVGFHYDVVRWYLGGSPWSNPETWRERSAYTHADRVSTPTILFHGEEDRVDTVGQSMNFHQALRWFDVPNRFVLFPREGHGIREPRHHRTRLVEELRWFQHHVRGDAGWEAPDPPGAADGDADASGEDGG